MTSKVSSAANEKSSPLFSALSGSESKVSTISACKIREKAFQEGLKCEKGVRLKSSHFLPQLKTKVEKSAVLRVGVKIVSAI